MQAASVARSTSLGVARSVTRKSSMPPIAKRQACAMRSKRPDIAAANWPATLGPGETAKTAGAATKAQ